RSGPARHAPRRRYRPAARAGLWLFGRLLRRDLRSCARRRSRRPSGCKAAATPTWPLQASTSNAGVGRWLLSESVAEIVVTHGCPGAAAVVGGAGIHVVAALLDERWSQRWGGRRCVWANPQARSGARTARSGRSEFAKAVVRTPADR